MPIAKTPFQNVKNISVFWEKDLWDYISTILETLFWNVKNIILETLSRIVNSRNVFSELEFYHSEKEFQNYGIIRKTSFLEC